MMMTVMGSDDGEDGGEMMVLMVKVEVVKMVTVVGITAAVSGLYVLIHLVSRTPLQTK